MRSVACEMTESVSRGPSVDIAKPKTGLLSNLSSEDKLVYHRKQEGTEGTHMPVQWNKKGICASLSVPFLCILSYTMDHGSKPSTDFSLESSGV